LSSIHANFVIHDYPINFSLVDFTSITLQSTIMSLLLRFYDPNSGVVSLDGVDIRDLNIRWLRSQIGYVGQEPVLFQGSIYENIVYGLDLELLNEKDDAKKKAFMGRVIEACKSANAHKFITSFSNGYDTAVGANGVSLSGGQKQRIAIARALIKKPAVLLLDEATSALDVISEQVVQEAIDKLQQSKAQTTLVIAHRLSTIRAADKIALVKDGKIAELGTHDELLAINGHYADLVTLQLTSAADDAVIAAGDASREVAAEENKDEERGRRETDEGAVRKSEGSEIIDDAKADKSKDVKEKGQLKRKIWKLMRPFWYWIALGLFGSLLVGASFPIWGLLLAQFQSAFYLTDTDEMRAESVVTSEYFILLGVMCLVGNIVQQFSIAQAGERAATVLRSMLFESFIRREISFFDKEENGAGSLTTRLADDARKIVQATGVNLASQLQAIFTLFVAMIIGFTASWRISLVVLATFPITIFAGIISARFTVGQNFDPSGDSHGEIISSGFLHMRTVTAFSMQHRICNLYEEKTEEASRHKKRMSVPGGLALGFLNLTTYLMYSFLFW
jgi:ATP-binding cassette subfamily B (MDR/TAP) protein 1